MLHDDLSHFARTIVQGHEPASWIEQGYPYHSADAAIEIYRNNYRGNLQDALAGAYPVINQLVGDDFFRFMAGRFIGQHPSRNANLHRYGAELGDFVKAFEPAKELEYLPDVAALEWACHLAYFADDELTLDIGELALIAPERYSELILHLQPSCHFLCSRYPTSAIWHAHQPGASDDFDIALDSGSSNTLVFRQDDFVRVHELEDADTVWLRCIQAGTALGEATSETVERYPDFDLLPALQKLVALNIFAGFDLEETS